MKLDWIDGGVSAPEGFRASGLSAGIKKNGKKDLALVAADRPVAAAGVFTRNTVKAAPVLISRERLASGKAQAVLLNSGTANCLTGARGRKDALACGAGLAKRLGCSENDVLLASTGPIARLLPAERVLANLDDLVAQASKAGHAAAAEAILTTDLCGKEAAVEFSVKGKRVRVGGMAKGSGMIAPSMATMLCVITTDAGISAARLRRLLAQGSDASFNRISVDGDMSTNDCVFALASGDSGVAIKPGSAEEKRLAEAFAAVMEKLAVAITMDGEGATKLLKVVVEQARSEKEALACARQIALSPLVKTMITGADPNVGRIASAAGASPARFDPAKLEIRIGKLCVVRNGAACAKDLTAVSELMRAKEILVTVRLGAGAHAGHYWTCDLTKEYVRINAEYFT